MNHPAPGLAARARNLARATVLCVALSITVLAVAAGCSSQPVPVPVPVPTPKASNTPERSVTPSQPMGTPIPVAIATQADVAKVYGRLPGERRKQVRKQVTAVIDGWWDAAYLQGPPAKVKQAFPGFTSGARLRAHSDKALMTNTNLKAESVTPVMKKVRLDLLAVNKHAKSVTARFDLRMRAEGGRQGRLRVLGRLFLTKKSDGWRIFGYDVRKAWV